MRRRHAMRGRLVHAYPGLQRQLPVRRRTGVLRQRLRERRERRAKLRQLRHRVRKPGERERRVHLGPVRVRLRAGIRRLRRQRVQRLRSEPGECGELRRVRKGLSGRRRVRRWGVHRAELQRRGPVSARGGVLRKRVRQHGRRPAQLRQLRRRLRDAAERVGRLHFGAMRLRLFTGLCELRRQRGERLRSEPRNGSQQLRQMRGELRAGRQLRERDVRLGLHLSRAGSLLRGRRVDLHERGG